MLLLLISLICDGVADCEDHSDEWSFLCDRKCRVPVYDLGFGCETKIKKPSLFNGINTDGIINGTPESNDTGTLNTNQMGSKREGYCLHFTYFCDGYVNCKLVYISIQIIF